MNTRVLELLKNPELLLENDLQNIEKEVVRYPYVQSVRALYLLGVNRFQQNIYPEELTKTAAYTTDKKILYHLINKNKSEIKTENKVETAAEKEEYIVENITKNADVVDEHRTDVHEKSIEIEPTEEEKKSTDLYENSYKTNDFVEEKITDKEEEQYAHLIDFYNVDFPTSHLAEKVEENTIEFENTSIEQELEEPCEQTLSSSIDFYVSPVKAEPENDFVVEKEIAQQEDSSKNEQEIITSEAEEYVWKPMQFEDIQPVVAKIEPEKNFISEENHTTTEKTDETQEERPVLNVSFFTSDVEKIEEISPTPEETIPAEEPRTEPETTHQQNPQDSNVSSFINTWQNWLKIDRTNLEKEEVSKKTIEKKANVIDKFIETSPKISQMKEEVDFVVKEKTDDISHLMTETLAKLYVEQKLYTKAIKAYEILQNKYPEKASEFSKEIEAIKELKPGR